MTSIISQAAKRLATALMAATGAETVGFGAGTVADELEALGPVVPARTVSLSEVMSKTVAGGELVIGCFGDSLTYGQNGDGTLGPVAGINGSSNKRAQYQYPEALQAALTRAGYTVTVNNYGFPGDTTTDGLARWAEAPASDVAIIMYGTNDAKLNGGGPTVSAATYKANLAAMVRREQAKGAFVVLLTPPRIKDSNLVDGSTIQRQKFLRVFESVIAQIGKQFSVPVVSVDQLIAHRGADAYSDGVHLSLYGYNEWGWGLSALFAQGGTEAKSIAGGTVIHAAGSSITGQQALVNGKTVVSVGGITRLCVSGYFEEALVARVSFVYNTPEGGTQAAKIVMGGGARNAAIQEARAVQMTAGPGRVVNTDVIPKGYRTFFIEPAVAGNAYVEKVEFVRPVGILTDTVYEYAQVSALRGLTLEAKAEANRWVVDEGMRLVGDFTIEADLATAPGLGGAAGLSLVAEFNEDTGIPSKFINVLRFENTGQAFVRVANGGAFDDTFYANAFPAASTVIKIVRQGDDFAVYAGGTLLVTKAAAFGRVLPAVVRTDAAVTVNKLGAR